MRKYLIVALAALTAVAFATVAFAQGADTATLSVKLTPKNAGTKTKPKNSSFTLDVVNDNTNRTMSDLDVFIAKTARISLKGMPKCAAGRIITRSCPASSELGHGEAHALVGVNGGSKTPLDFTVTAYKTNSPTTGKEMLGFFIDDGGALTILTETKLTKVSGRKFGQKLHIDVPEQAQKLGASTYNGLVSLKTTLTKKKGRNLLVASTGCNGGKHRYKAVLTFIDNTVTTATKYGDTASAKCTK